MVWHITACLPKQLLNFHQIILITVSKKRSGSGITCFLQAKIHKHINQSSTCTSETCLPIINYKSNSQKDFNPYCTKYLTAKNKIKQKEISPQHQLLLNIAQYMYSLQQLHLSVMLMYCLEMVFHLLVATSS